MVKRDGVILEKTVPSRAVTSPLPEEEGLGEKVELSLQERRRGRKKLLLASNASQKEI